MKDIIKELTDKHKTISTMESCTGGGVGITGKLNRIDRFNMSGSDNTVYISIYDSYNNKYYTDTMRVTLETRIDNKDAIICKIVEILGEII